ncbi:MAG: hypothetical protein JW785_10975 [Acidimicrobiia bacterium]|nr:hypothetical protein [Acidimicrobiia bacterium]
MALIECPECGEQVSTLAAACPHCGFPISAEAGPLLAPPGERGPSRWTDPGFWIILAGLVAVIVMSILILRHAEDGPPPEGTTPATTVGAPVLLGWDQAQ